MGKKAQDAKKIGEFAFLVALSCLQARDIDAFEQLMTAHRIVLGQGQNFN